jgi:hypothetical protein
VASASPAPPGTASATGLNLGQLLSLSDTEAQAGPSTTQSDASVISLGGEPILGLGGSSTGGDPASGALLDLGEPGGIQVQAAPWEASTSSSSDGDFTTASRGSEGTSAASRAAVARAAVPSVAEAHVVESESQATHTDVQSTGAAVSNGVRLHLFDAVRLTLLHSEVSSSGVGSSHLVGLNDTEIGTDEQLSGACSLALGPIASVLCLTATGGAGNNAGDLTSAAGVADVNSGLLSGLVGDALPLAAFAVTGGTGTGASPVVAAPVAPADGAESSAAVIEAPRGAVDAADDTAGIQSALARTGATAMDLLPWGIATLGFGAGLRMLGRRRSVLV